MNKAEIRELINQQTDEFFAAGGVIEKLPPQKDKLPPHLKERRRKVTLKDKRQDAFKKYIRELEAEVIGK